MDCFLVDKRIWPRAKTSLSSGIYLCNLKIKIKYGGIIGSL